MLKKLVKYDLKWINKIMYVYYVIAIILAILTRISGYFTDSFIGNIIYSILRGTVISSFVSCLITCLMRIWSRFRNNLYKDESYLTHTLPLSKNTLYNSKLISSAIVVLSSLLIIILSFCIAFLNDSTWEFIKNIFAGNKVIIIGLLITFVLEIVYMTFCGILGIIIGNRFNNSKTLKAIIAGVLIYFAIQVVNLGFIYLFGLFNESINVLFTNAISFDMQTSMQNLVILANSIYLIFIMTMYFIGKKVFSLGVNVE